MVYTLVLVVSLGLASQVSGACERAILQEATSAYSMLSCLPLNCPRIQSNPIIFKEEPRPNSFLVSAQTSGKPSLLPLTPNTTYFENDTPLSLTSTSSILS